LSRIIVRYRLLFLIGWPLAVVLLVWLVPPLQEVTREEQEGYLPPDAETSQAFELLERSGFRDEMHRSAIVVVLESTEGPIQPGQVRVATELIRRRSEAPGSPLAPINAIHSPAEEPALRPLMTNPDGSSQMILLTLETVFITRESTDAVAALRDLIDNRLPEELKAAGLETDVRGWLVGDAVLGYDLGRASEESLRRMTWATIVLVLTILLVVYRSPLAPLVSLVTIGLAYLTSDRMLSLVTLHLDIGFSPIVSHFMLVVIFGAGTDYCLFLVGRFREELGRGRSTGAAMRQALGRTGAAIVSSAVTTMLGLGLMCFARFWAFRSLGPAVGFSLGLTLLVALSFAPAFAALVGRKLFWPAPVSGRHRQSLNRFWLRVGRIVTTHPVRVLVGVGVIALPFLIVGARMRPSYDLSAELPEESEFRRGFNAIDRLGYPPQRFFPVTIVFDSAVDPSTGYELGMLNKVRIEDDSPAAALQGIVQDAVNTPAVDNVRSLVTPLGTDRPIPYMRESDMTRIRRNYRARRTDAEGRWVGTMDAMLAIEDPYRPSTLDQYERVLGRIRTRLEQAPFDSRSVHAMGTTAYIDDIRDVTTADFYRVVALVVAGVLVVLAVLTRSPFIPVYLVGTMLLGYLVTMGVTMLIFGPDNIDWKVRFFMLILLIAIGVDYNIFLVTRIREEAVSRSYPNAVTSAVANTGGIISSCGVIMAGTFASMMLGTLAFLVQLGFAIAAGVLLDTFVIRPMVVPAISMLHYRVKRRLRGESG
jgi:RND superfamily putative drug exporter